MSYRRKYDRSRRRYRDFEALKTNEDDRVRRHSTIFSGRFERSSFCSLRFSNLIFNRAFFLSSGSICPTIRSHKSKGSSSSIHLLWDPNIYGFGPYRPRNSNSEIEKSFRNAVENGKAFVGRVVFPAPPKVCFFEQKSFALFVGLINLGLVKICVITRQLVSSEQRFFTVCGKNLRVSHDIF